MTIGNDDPFGSEGEGEDPFTSGGAAQADEVFEAAVPTEEELGLPAAGEKYIAQIVAISHEISKSSGSPMFKWESRLISNMEGDTTCAGFEPKPMYTVLGAKAAWKMDAVCAALGLKPGEDNKYKFTREQVIGLMFVCVLDADEYKGQAQRNIGEMEPHPKGAGYQEPIHASDDVPF